MMLFFSGEHSRDALRTTGSNNHDAVLEDDGLDMIMGTLKKNHNAALMEDLLES